MILQHPDKEGKKSIYIEKKYFDVVVTSFENLSHIEPFYHPMLSVYLAHVYIIIVKEKF